MMIQDAYHKGGETFDHLRFTPENRRKMNKITVIPFSSGKRRCIGQYMGEMMVKIMVSMTIRKFEFKTIEGHVPRKVQKLTYGLEENTMYFRPRPVNP